MSNGNENPYYAGGGGGFVQGGGSPYGSQESPGGKKTRGGNQTIRPVTVKQIIEATQVHNDSDFVIDGVDVGSILLVGSVHNKSASATNVSYEIGDGTGYIDVRQWLDSADDELGKMDGIEQDRYVGIMGSIKVFGNKRHVSATHIRAIKNHDEIYHHLLKATWVSLSLRNPNGPAPAARNNDYSAGATNGGGMESAYAQLPPLQRSIMELVSANDDDDGMHVSAVSKSVGGMSNGEAVMEAIELLMGEGMLFSTIDDLHVKST